MNQQELFNNLVERLKENAQVTSPELEARWIIERALGVSATRAITDGELEIEPANLSFIEEATQKRLEGMPLAYVLGEKEFYGLNFIVNPSVLIPRPESEHIVDMALKWIKDLGKDCKEVRVLDLGAGSGCLGLSILKNCSIAKLCSVDVSVDALDVTDFNSKSLGVDENTTLLSMDVADLKPSDLPESFGGKVDLILANPPYIDESDEAVDPWVRQYEPSLALFSDEGGLGHLRRWAQTLPAILTNPGLALFEIGHNQAEQALQIIALLNQDEFQLNAQIHKDYSGKDRILSIERKS